MGKAQAFDFKRMSGNQLARALGVTHQAVGAWHKRDGCPRNEDGTYDLSQVFRWREQRAAGTKTEDDWATEKDKWLALKHRAQTLVTEGKLVPLSEVAAFWAERATVARASLQSVGQSVAPACIGLEVTAIRDLIDSRLRAICDDLSREFEESLEENQRDDGGGEGVALAPEPDPEPVE